MKGGLDLQKYVDLLVPGEAKITLLQGEGPINLVGSHCVDYFGLRKDGAGDTDDEDEATTDEEDAEADVDMEQDEKKTPSKEDKKKTPSKEEKKTPSKEEEDAEADV